ncbi:MAG TPA: hypothetical protein VND22_04510 [Actinomycetota bacterium]|nr:hypothetical protein [Actinomycetota bacterium]
MSSSLIAAVVGTLLIAGGFGASRFTRWISKQGDRKIVLIAAVTAWFTLFGMTPFFAFAVLVGKASANSVPPIATFILNLVPFALVAAPFVGFVQGMRLTKPWKKSASSRDPV